MRLKDYPTPSHHFIDEDTKAQRGDLLKVTWRTKVICILSELPLNLPRQSGLEGIQTLESEPPQTGGFRLLFMMHNQLEISLVSKFGFSSCFKVGHTCLFGSRRLHLNYEDAGSTTRS